MTYLVNLILQKDFHKNIALDWNKDAVIYENIWAIIAVTLQYKNIKEYILTCLNILSLWKAQNL